MLSAASRVECCQQAVSRHKRKLRELRQPVSHSKIADAPASALVGCRSTHGRIAVTSSTAVLLSMRSTGHASKSTTTGRVAQPCSKHSVRQAGATCVCCTPSPWPWYHKLAASACLPAACQTSWRANERTITKFGSTWWYNWANRPTGYDSADQCDLCRDGATMATFRTSQEKSEIVDTWAFGLSQQPFFFGYSIEPGTVFLHLEVCKGLHAVCMACCSCAACGALHGCPCSCGQAAALHAAGLAASMSRRPVAASDHCSCHLHRQ